MQIEENRLLAQLTTFGIGGPARWFATATSEDEIEQACAWAREHKAPLFILGGGSNLLVADAGFDGLVLQVALKGIAREDAIFRVAAGELWESFVDHAVAANCAGVECLAGIPGTVGGTPVQNVGAYGQEVASVIERVRAFNLESQKFIEFSNAECGFAYRKSRFNGPDRGRYIVTRVNYRLRPDGAPRLVYQDLKAHFNNGSHRPSLAEVVAAVREIRHGKGMLFVEGETDCRSAGSFFKNPEVALEAAARVRQIAASAGIEPRIYPAGEGKMKISAAWLIEQSGFKKGFALGAAAISSRHTLALVNRGGARAEGVLALAKKIQAAVNERFGIQLEIEPVRVGF